MSGNTVHEIDKIVLIEDSKEGNLKISEEKLYSFGLEFMKFYLFFFKSL